MFLILWVLQSVVFWRGSARIQNSLIFLMLFWTALRAAHVLLWWKFPSLLIRALFIFRSLWHYTGAVALAMRGPLKHPANLKVGEKNWLNKSRNCQTGLYHDLSRAPSLYYIWATLDPFPYHRSSPSIPPYDKHYCEPVSSQYLISSVQAPRQERESRLSGDIPTPT